MQTKSQQVNSGLRSKDSRPHIIMVVARGEAVRNFIFMDTLRLLSQQARVTLLSLVNHGQAIEYARPFVEQITPLKTYHENGAVNLLRNTLHYAHFRWIWSEAAKCYWGNYTSKAKTVRGQLRWGWYKTTARMLGFRPILESLTPVEETMSWIFRPTRDFDRLFSELQPDLVFNCSHIHGPEADLPMRVAHRLGIPTAVFVFSWDNLTSRSRIFVPYDHYLMWNDDMKQQLLQQYPYLKPEQVHVTGTPQFDVHFKSEFLLSRHELCQRLGLDPLRPFVLYTTGMDSDFPYEHRMVEAVIAYLKEIDIQPRPQLVVRTYIKGTSPEMQALSRQAIPDVVFPPILWDKQWTLPLYEDLTIYTSLLHHASLGINVASTVSLELMMLDKPVINLGFEPPETDLPHWTRFSRHVEYEHYKPVVQSGGVMVARSLDELRQLIYRGLTQPQADSQARQHFIQKMFDSSLDGLSGQRIADQLITISKIKVT